MASPTTSARSLRLLPLALLAFGSCTTPNQFLPSYQPGGPQGILGGTVTYAGPLPCTEGGHVVGAAVLLVFDTRLLPPPEGLGTTATSLATVPGDTLFGGVLDRLTFHADGSEWCPGPGSQVTVSGDFTAGPLPGGIYEVRGFYDLHGQFNPAFAISKLPHQGDIAGGAIDNAAAVLTGSAPVYRQIQLGTPETDSMGNPTGNYVIPDTGSNIDGIAVTLALPLPLALPIFYPSGVYYSPNACKIVGGMPTVVPVSPPPASPATLSCGPTSSTTGTACSVTMPSDYTLPTFSATDPAGTEQSIPRIVLNAGVAPANVTASVASPFNFPGKLCTANTDCPSMKCNMATHTCGCTVATQATDCASDQLCDPTTLACSATLNVSWTGAYSPASSIVPSLFPLTIFSLSTPGNDLTAQASPAIILQAITINQSLLNTVLSPPMKNGPGVDVTSLIAGLVPAVICIDPTDFSPNAQATLLLSHKTDCMGNALLTDEQGTLAALAKQFGRKVVDAEGCLPQGRYQMNLVYGTGQAWSVPNEAGICASSEPQSSDGTQCASPNQPNAIRARMSSEDVVLTIGPPSDPTWCAKNPTPAACLPPTTSGM